MSTFTNEDWEKARGNDCILAVKKAEKKSVDIFIKYQKELLETTSLNEITLVEKSRRTGITWSAAADAVLVAAAGKEAKGSDVLYMGYNLDMAREFIDVCADWAKAFNVAVMDVEEEYVFRDLKNNDDGSKDIKAFRIRFASGGQIIALPSSPRSLRGKQGFVIIDEAAFHDDLKALMKAAKAMLIWGGKILVISTHDGADNYFNQLITDTRSGELPYALMRLTFDQALADGLFERICLMRGKPYSDEALAEWRKKILLDFGDDADEELHVIPSKSEGSWLPITLIDGRMDGDIPVIRIERKDEFKSVAVELREIEIEEWCEKELKPLLDKCDLKLDHSLGGDFGRTGDLTCFWPVAKLQNTKLHTPFIVEIRNMPFAQQQQILEYICDRLPNLNGVALDARGIGAQMSEAMADEYSREIVAEIMATENFYRDEMPKFKKALEDAVFDLPRDTDVSKDFRSVQKIRGVPKVPEKRTKDKNKKKRHGDTVIAAVFAFIASKQDPQLFAYRAVPRPSTQADKIPSNKYSMPSRFGNNKRTLM